MPLLDGSTLFPSTVHYYKAATGTPPPADPRSPGAAWVEIGHTSLEKLANPKADGGKSETKGSAQNPSLRSVETDITYSMEIDLEQFDRKSLELFYGMNVAQHSVNGWTKAPTKRKPTMCSLLVVLIDGDRALAWHADMVSIKGNGDPKVDKKGDISSLPLLATFLEISGSGSPFNFWAVGSTSTSMTAGTPGTFAPAGSVIPFDIAELAFLVSIGQLTLPANSTAGQYWTLGNGANAHVAAGAFVSGIKA